MDEPGGFFDIAITDEFVSNLDDLTYADLVTILRDHFDNEHHQFKKITEGNHHLEAEITSGECNIQKLGKIKEEHLQQKLRIGSELELVEIEC